jgi:hypothetical protein
MKNGGSENGDGTVVVVDLSTNTPIAEELLDSNASPEGIVFAGNKVFVAGRGDMYIVDVSNPANPSFIGTSGVAERELVASPDGAWVYAEDNAVRVSDNADFTTGDFSGERGVAINPAGTRLFSTDEDDSVRVVTVTPGNPPTTTFLQDITDATQSESYGIDLTDDGTRGVVSFRGSDTVRIFDPVNLTFIGSPIDMQFGVGTGMIFGSEPKQLVISHAAATPTASPTPSPTPSLEPTQIEPSATCFHDEGDDDIWGDTDDEQDEENSDDPPQNGEADAEAQNGEEDFDHDMEPDDCWPPHPATPSATPTDTPSPTPSPSQTPQEDQAAQLTADANCDNAVNPFDALAVVLFVSGSDAGCTGLHNGSGFSGDADCNGAVDTVDAVNILRQSAGLSAVAC